MARTGMTKAEKLADYPRVSAFANRVDCMLSDVMNDRVTFGAWVSDPDGGKYRVGISRCDTFPICMVTFRHKGQSDSIMVYNLDEHDANMRRYRAGSACYEPELRAMESAKDAVRAKAENAAA